MRAKVTNVDVGIRIELGHTAVSRIRSGDRKPSIITMMRIATEFNWNMDDQARHAVAGTYAKAFEERLVELYGEESDDETAPNGTPA